MTTSKDAFIFITLVLATSWSLLHSSVSAKMIEGADNRIIGGSNVSKNTYPWFTMLLFMIGNNENEQGCGGMLVAPEWVLTAAHCIDTDISNNGAVRIGALEKPYKQGNNGGQDVEFFKLKKVIKHPQYNSRTTNNDYALLKLDGTSTITPVSMDSTGVANSFTTGRGNIWAIGLGNTRYPGQSFPSHLKHVEVKYVTNSDCTTKYGYSNGDITNNMLCARDSSKDSCQGDSGGPLYDATNKKLIGIVSWGEGCALANYPGVYARVSAQYDWIKSIICSDSSASFCGNAPTAPTAPTPTAPTPTAPTPTAPTPTAPTPTPPTSSDCDDTSLKFQVRLFNGRLRFKTCVWARKKKSRCILTGVSENCPSTCNSCDECVDAPLKIKVRQNGKLRTKDCFWANSWRCSNIVGLQESCRVSCDQCPTDDYYYYYYYDDFNYYDDDFFFRGANKKQKNIKHDGKNDAGNE